MTYIDALRLEHLDDLIEYIEYHLIYVGVKGAVGVGVVVVVALAELGVRLNDVVAVAVGGALGNDLESSRAAVCGDTFSARLTRMHNDANVLCFGERVVGFGLACDLVDNFIDAEFEGGKHQKRVDLITAIETKEIKG